MTQGEMFELVKVYPNFVSDEDCNTFCDFLNKSLNQNTIRHRSKNFWNILRIKDESIKGLFDKLVDAGIKTIDYKNPLYVMEYVVNFMGEGAFIPEHNDQEGNSNYTWSSIYYFNNPSEYTGGEINYPELGVYYRPHKGTMITHPATYLHEVMPVKSGFRYSLSVFFTENKDCEFFFQGENQ